MGTKNVWVKFGSSLYCMKPNNVPEFGTLFGFIQYKLDPTPQYASYTKIRVDTVKFRYMS